MSAVISECGLYRYRLERKLRPSCTKPCVFIMLNPSTADAELDDPTIRRCKAFAEREGCGQLVVVNLFAYRATKPADLYKASDPVGADNDSHITEALKFAKDNDGVVICGWGANDPRARDWRVRKLAQEVGVPLLCLGKAKNGSPRHPLYLASDSALEAA